MRIGICRNLDMWNHSSYNGGEGFADCCRKLHLDYTFLDPYSNDILSEAENCDIVIWGIQNYLWADLLESRSILRVLEWRGKTVFPDRWTNWHFDDKIAEMYALQAVGAPMPESWVFYSRNTALQFFRETEFPVIVKLRNGSGASNVKCLKNYASAKRYVGRMFGRGFDPTPSLAYKAFSKAQSSHDWNTLLSRVKKLPEFLYTRRHAKMMPRERGYVYCQEFIPNDGYDLKIVVCGNKLTFLCRNTRKGDFRASGGGDVFYDRSLVTPQIRASAFETADRLKMQLVGFDYVVDRRTGEGKILEMCYGFDFQAAASAGGFFTRQSEWIEEPIDVHMEVVKALMSQRKRYEAAVEK